jgi:hypothetical protein
MRIASAPGLGLLLAASVLVGACGAKTVNTVAVEKNVMSTINGPGSVKVASVDCPKDQVAKVGKTFTCSFELTDGSVGELTVNVADEDGTARWNVTRPASGQAEQEVLTGYEEKTGKAVKRVNCPDPIRGGTNAKTTCTMKLKDGTSRPVVVTVNRGKIKWRT